MEHEFFMMNCSLYAQVLKYTNFNIIVVFFILLNSVLLMVFKSKMHGKINSQIY